MKSIEMLAVGLVVFGGAAIFSLGQAPTTAPRSGPGVQAAQDAREPEVLKGCKTPPPARGGARGPAGAPGRGAANAAQPAPRVSTVTEVPGVVAAGQQWKE